MGLYERIIELFMEAPGTVKIPEIELMSPQEDPLAYIVAAKTSLRAKKFEHYTPAQIEQLDKDLDLALRLGSAKYEKKDADIPIFLFNQRILLALDLFPLKEQVNYGEYLRIKYEEPVTKR